MARVECRWTGCLGILSTNSSVLLARRLQAGCGTMPGPRTRRMSTLAWGSCAGIGASPGFVWESIIRGDGRQLQIEGPEFRVGEGVRCRSQMAGGGGRKRFRLCRVRGDSRQGRHFHGETFDVTAQSGTGFGQQGSLIKPDAAGPGRTRRQKDNPSIADVREPGLARDCGGQEVAQSFIQRIQRARAIRERVECDALRSRLGADGGVTEGVATWRHDEHELGATQA